MTSVTALLLGLLATVLSPGTMTGTMTGTVTGMVTGSTPVPAPSRHGEWPLVPRPAVIEGFDPPREAWGAGHRGVDLLGHAGQGVRSSLPGVVTFAAPLAGRGVVVVEHGGSRTTYEPVSASVEVGSIVSAGEEIGTLQRRHSHCAPAACLHWGLIRGTTYLDPLTLVGAGPVRLLPLTPEATGVGAARFAPGSTAPLTAALAAGFRPGGAPAGRPGVAGPW